MHLVTAFTEDRLRLEQAILTLPRLESSDQTDHGNPCWKLQRRWLDALVGDRCAGSDNVRRAGGEQVCLRLSGGPRIATDRAGGEQGCAAIQPTSPRRNRLLPPNDSTAHLSLI